MRASPTSRGDRGREARDAEASVPRFLLNQILQSLERGRTDLLARGLRRNRDRRLGERGDALALFRRRLLHHAELDQPRNHELARATRRELLADELLQRLEATTHALLVQIRSVRDLSNHLRLRQSLSSHALPPSLRFLESF